MTDQRDDAVADAEERAAVAAAEAAASTGVEVSPPPPPLDGADLGRRRFFRQFAGDLLQGAATVAGAAQVLQRASAEAASAILDPSSVAPLAGPIDVAGVAVAVPPTGFRTPFREEPGVLHIIDQRKLPDALEEYHAKSAAECAFAIREMIVRGAPAIGQVAAIGLAITAGKLLTTRPYARRATLRGAANALRNSRPTAINLRWAVDRVMAAYEAVGDLSEDGEAIAAAMRVEADAIVSEATDDHGRLATYGRDELAYPDGRPLRVLTHCNTGPLACGQFGTALGVVQAAHYAERPLHVWVDETRPYLQGARLTAWELAQAGVPHTLIPDVAAGHLMATGEVDVIIVGADRIVANGDTANKVGTYTLAVLAARHQIPFYVAAPMSSVDLATTDGSEIPIEERKANEVLYVRGVRIAPPDTDVRNPSFDVTPAELITGFITDEGVLRTPFETSLAEAMVRRDARRAALRPPVASVPSAIPSAEAPAPEPAAETPAAEPAAEPAAAEPAAEPAAAEPATASVSAAAPAAAPVPVEPAPRARVDEVVA